MKRTLFPSILIVFFTIMSFVGCNNQNIIEEQSSLSQKKINGYSESVASEPIVESPKVTSKIPDSKIWEYFEDNWYYNKNNITKSSNIIKVWTYKIVTDDIRKKMIELRKKYDVKESKKYKRYDHYISLEVFDCKKKLRKREESVDYDNEGNVLDHGKYKKSKWKKIISKSVMDKLYDKICVTPQKTSQVWAEDWVLYNTSHEGKVYYDERSIKELDKNIINVWTKTILNKKGKTEAFSILKSMGKAPENSDTVSYELTLEQYDCVNEKYKSISTTIYDKKSNVLLGQKATIDKWSDIRPESIAGELKSIVCSADKTSQIKKK